MNYDQMALVRLLKTISDTVNSDVNDVYQNMNTLIQFFSAPHDSITTRAWTGVFLGSGNLSDSQTDNVTLSVTVTPNVVAKSSLAWGGYDANGNYINPNFTWGYGGVYS